MDKITHRDAAEAVALFRLQVLGALGRRQLRRGELRTELVTLSQQAFLAPGEEVPRCISVTTLERWYYALRKRGLAGLKPKSREDCGRARALTPQQHQLLLEIRQEYPSASVPLILYTLIRDGRLEQGIISAATLRRFYAQHGLDRTVAPRTAPHVRQRWQAETPCTLWHADVCHGPALRVGLQSQPLRIHALLDDASRYVVDMSVSHTERESDMLALMVKTWRQWGRSDLLYLDNGATYRGDTLATACARLGTTLLHAKPYDPQARGKMERFWRTLRQGCLNYLAPDCTLHDVYVRVAAFISQHYNNAPHAALMGKSPAQVWATRKARDTSETAMREALTVRATRRVANDGTVSIGGVIWESQQGFLAGRKVTVARSLLDVHAAPWVEYADKSYTLRLTDPVANGRRKRDATPPRKLSGLDVLFDPVGVLLNKPTPSSKLGGEL
jgi:putative transposase